MRQQLKYLFIVATLVATLTCFTSTIACAQGMAEMGAANGASASAGGALNNGSFTRGIGRLYGSSGNSPATSGPETSQGLTRMSKEEIEAMTYYGQKKYAKALSVLSGISKKDPGDVSAIYYAANCNFALGKKEEAKRLYLSIVNGHPLSNEAYSAKQVLQHLNAPPIKSSRVHH